MPKGRFRQQICPRLSAECDRGLNDDPAVTSDSIVSMSVYIPPSSVAGGSCNHECHTPTLERFKADSAIFSDNVANGRAICLGCTPSISKRSVSSAAGL